MQAALRYQCSMNGLFMYSPATDHDTKYPGFVCFKSQSPVHYPHRWQRDALIQAALDPAISAIRPLPAEMLRGHADFGFAITINTRPLACLITDTICAPTTAEQNSSILTISRAALKAEPLWSTARAVWSKKRLLIPPAVRYHALEIASKDDEGATAEQIVAAFPPFGGNEAVDYLCAMLASGFLVGDLTLGLNHLTKLRPGPQFEVQNSSHQTQFEQITGPSK